MSFKRNLARSRLLRHLPLMVAFIFSGVGVAGVAVLHAEEVDAPEASAFSAIAEVADAPIEDLASSGGGTLHRASDGLFHARIAANGRDLRCIVDTGASATVLSAADGRKIGVAPTRFDGRVHTAGGTWRAARGRIADVALAGRRFRNVPVIIVRRSPTPCLIGQSLLAKLEAVEFRGSVLTLR